MPVNTNNPRIAGVKPGTVLTAIDGPGQSWDPRFTDRIGIAYGILRSRWGDAIRVKMADYTFDSASHFNTAVRSHGPIGWYRHSVPPRVPVTPLPLP